MLVCHYSKPVSLTALHKDMSPDTQKATTQLPNAPLSEVVFELRWKLEGPDSLPIPLRNDPGYHVVADRFAAAASKYGFGYAKRLSADPQVVPYSINLRFYERQDQPFPLWQVTLVQNRFSEN